MTPAENYIAANMGLMWKLYYSLPWLRHHIERFRDDLEQLARVSLWKTWRTFDESKGYRHTTLAFRIGHNDVIKFGKMELVRRAVTLPDSARVKCFRPDVQAEINEEMEPYLERLEWANAKQQGDLFDELAALDVA